MATTCALTFAGYGSTPLEIFLDFHQNAFSFGHDLAKAFSR